MEKRKKRDIRKTRRSSKHQNLSVDEKGNLKFLDVENCVSLYLSPETQKYIGCQIGEDITPETPWIAVRKERIEDNLYLYENSSEFIPFRNIIDEYPEDTLLIGSYRTNQDAAEEFMLCITLDAKEKILELLGKEKEAIFRRVSQLVYCEPGTWQTLGSEVEVNGSQNVNLRNLYEVWFETKTPISLGVKKVVFRYRFASPIPELRTYDECLPDRRFIKKLVYKVRYDRASQITPHRINMKCQTTLTYPTNKYTQTDLKFYVLELTEAEDMILNKKLTNISNIMIDTLIVNFHINLYNEDYTFPTSYKQSYARDSKDLMNFHDVINCKDLFYGSVSWSAMISGLIAVSYVERARKLIVNQNYAIMDKKSSFGMYSDKIVLIWCYSDNLAAKLFMHSNFEITSISCCPYDQNLIIGGGCNGQVVIWDIKNKLEQAEFKEYLSITELNHRNIVRSHTSWVKWPPGVRHVFPTIISDMVQSHKSPIISIQWLPSYHRMTKNGQIEEMKCDESIEDCYLHPKKSYQFLTCSAEDSCVFVWEIKQSPHLLKPDYSSKKKNRRLTHLPDSLVEGISPLKKYNKNFQPFFKLNLDLPNSGDKDRRIFCTELLLKNPKAEYKALNPNTLENYRERTFFKEVIPKNPKPHSQTFAVCSESGFLLTCTWTANNFDQGQAINEQNCECTSFLAIHDGPILSCRSYLYYPECILTVGGSVFGVWITSVNKQPIFWRKSVCRYVSGLWSSTYPLLCVILREDNYIEFWDLIDYTTTPMRKTKLKGSKIIDFFSDSTRAHARKGTCLLTDLKGVIKVQDLPVFNTILLTKQECELISAQTIKNILKRKKHLQNLIDRLKTQFDLNKTDVINTQREIVQPIIKIEISDHQLEKKRKTQATKWQRKEEIRMYETLVQQKRIDVNDLNKNTTTLMNILNERLQLQKTVDEKLACKEEIFDSKKQRILQSFIKVKSKKLTVGFPREIERMIKDQYLDDYLEIERQTMKNIHVWSHHHIEIDWKTILGKRKADLQQAMKKVNIMDRRSRVSNVPPPESTKDTKDTEDTQKRDSAIITFQDKDNK